LLVFGTSRRSRSTSIELRDIEQRSDDPSAQTNPVTISGTKLEAVQVQRKLADAFRYRFGMDARDSTLLALQMIGDLIRRDAGWLDITITADEAYQALRALREMDQLDDPEL
jgi:hypothetical protein